MSFCFGVSPVRKVEYGRKPGIAQAPPSPPALPFSSSGYVKVQGPRNFDGRDDVVVVVIVTVSILDSVDNDIFWDKCVARGDDTTWPPACRLLLDVRPVF